MPNYRNLGCNEDLVIANTILQQLGGNRFAVMTGAKNFVGMSNGLMFGLRRGAKNGINKVRITLDPSDTYTVEFYKIRGVNVSKVSESDMVYADSLRKTFESATGLYTSL